MVNIKKISKKTSVLIAAIVISSGATYLFCQSQFSEERDVLNDQIHNLEESANKAKVIQRISEQMEDIAYQSKNIADSARNKAELESKKALEQAHRAEEERHNALLAKAKADVAEQQAREQAAKAEKERLAAEHAQLVAEQERAKADTMRYISLGRSLAQASITQYNIGEKDIASLLAYSAYTFTREYGGNPYQQDVFTSLLYSAHNARNRITTFKGNVRALECISDPAHPKTDKNIIAATDYGEIGLMTPRNINSSKPFDGFDNTLLFNNSNYLFRDMCLKDSIAYILDVEGRIMVINISNSVRRLTKQSGKVKTSGKSEKFESFSVASTIHPRERWTHLLLKKNGQMIAVGEHQVTWFDPKTHEIIREKYIDENITEAGIGDGKLLIFTDKEKYYTFKEGVPSKWPFEVAKQCDITAYYYLKAEHLHVIGTSIGSILFYDDGGNPKYTFTGHTGPITHIESADWCLVSSSYDKTVRVWDINSLGDLTIPLEIKCSAWPLIFDIDPTVSTIRLGYSDGGVETIRYSAEDNAASVQRHLQRDFTPSEWKYYVGEDIPYLKFK